MRRHRLPVAIQSRQKMRKQSSIGVVLDPFESQMFMANNGDQECNRSECRQAKEHQTQPLIHPAEDEKEEPNHKDHGADPYHLRLLGLQLSNRRSGLLQASFVFLPSGHGGNSVLADSWGR